MIKLLPLILVSVLALPVSSASAADAGIYTIVDGDVRVLRGTTWYRLAPGARVQDGDIVDAGGLAQLQLELTDGGTLNAQAPALLHAAALAVGGGKPAGLPEITIQRGWFKATAPGKRPLRLRLPAMTVDVADAIVVLHADARVAELFVESGTAKLSLPSARGKDAPLRDAKGGEFASRAGDRVPVVADRPPQAFLAAMPRQFRDALPPLAGRFASAPGALAAGQEVTLAEAEPWLSGPNRRSFVRRFTPRLGDPAFRGGIAARPAAFPEWDRILHPEKYQPKETSGMK